MDIATTPANAVTTLNDVDSGAWRVTTTSGSVYDLDFDEGLLTRVPDTANVDGSLRRDGSTVILGSVIRCTVGERALLLIDLDVEGVAFTARDTTEVVSIVAIGELSARPSAAV